MNHEQIDAIFTKVCNEDYCTDPLYRFTELVIEQIHTNNKAKWYQEGYEAGQRDAKATQK